MSAEKPKLPKRGGAKRALLAIKKFRNHQPSERLIKIISEYGDVGAEVPNGESTVEPKVAKDVEI
ncbi:hypothetical protein D3C87_1222450 [compost metagenome]